ncbi:COR domain-containing protein [Actinoplanes sp. URMC 104]|uniref:COR domain-containing protein n=1 Tax=Actinoplanes sp. URMC 104 TaxID=3423409 RepID=UPI003F1A9663
MARWWRSKTGSRTDLTPAQAEILRAVLAGHLDTLDFDTLVTFVETEGVAVAARRLAGLRKVDTDKRIIRRDDDRALPDWLSDLGGLEEIDVRGMEPTYLPPHRQARWALDADTLVRLEVAPSLVYAVDIGSDTTEPVLEKLLTVARTGNLRLSELRITGAIVVPTGAPFTTDDWGALTWIQNNADALLSTQPSLESLMMFGCPLGHVPPAISRLHRLEKLDLAAVRPRSLPDWLFTLPSLTDLALAFNGLTDLPQSVSLARGLRSLDLRSNEFRSIPSSVWNLHSLQDLHLDGCPISEVPADVLRLSELVTLTIGSDQLASSASRVPDEFVSPPPEVAQQGLEAIKRYWLQNEEAGVDYLAEAKLLIIGEPGAGKTSLTKKILNPSYSLDESEDSTEGIDVHTWSFPSAIRVRDGGAERMLDRAFRVNVWDFGGQEIYHATHQFFLTKRSVYVLVCDERKEDTDFQYWLDVVNLLSGASPLIIVQNRKQGRAQALNTTGLRQAYPHLRDTISLNLADNSGLDDAVAKIRQEVESLPHIGAALPKTWRDVRVALERDTRDYISAEEFFRICRTHGFTRDDDIRQLGGFLHDLGICLYFQDDDLLRKTVILKPEWGTSAVYRVLDDDEVISRLGVFARNDLPRIWHEQSFAGMHAELVQLMVKFALCFPVDGPEQRYVAPQLLSPAQPAYAWSETGTLALRYEYDVMPKGIVRRLIVALHDLIDGPLVWRSGVVLTHDHGRAELIEEYHRRRLRIRLDGADPRTLLAIIDRELTLIHRSYPEIRFSKLRPCNCAVCQASAEPGMFPVSELEDFARTGDLIQCRVSRKLLDPVPLLAELSPDPVWRTGAVRQERVAPEPEVFVSYKWGGQADALVDGIVTRLGERGVAVVRDRDEMSYRDSIRGFMRRLGAGKAVVVVLDKAYLESENCMFELTEIAARPEFRDRVFPIVLADAGIFRPIDRVKHVGYWERQKAELEDAMRGVGQENLQGIREDLDLYERIRNTVAGITDILRDMNTLTPEMHRGAEFAQLHEALEKVLGTPVPGT